MRQRMPGTASFACHLSQSKRIIRDQLHVHQVSTHVICHLHWVSWSCDHACAAYRINVHIGMALSNGMHVPCHQVIQQSNAPEFPEASLNP